MIPVKICGITNATDAQLAVKLGASAIGMIFYPQSPRYVSDDQAGLISNSVGNNIAKVGVFVNESIDNIQNSMINNLNQNKEDYIVDYEKKNKYFQKRKDSLKNMLSKNLNKNIAAQIQEQIKKDSLEELEYYRSFDKIQRINE